MLTPAQIEAKQFTTVRLEAGYRQSEVDDFLDEVKTSYEKVWNDATSYANQLRARTPQKMMAQPEAETQVLPPVTAVPSIESIAMLLQNAQATADRIVSEADDEAASIIANAMIDADAVKKAAEDGASWLFADAKQQAATTMATAASEAERVKVEGLAERNAAVGALEMKRDQLQAHVDQLTGVRSAVADALKVALTQVMGEGS